MIKNKKKALFFAVIFILTVGILITHFFWKIVRIDGRNFMAELSLTRVSQERGLGGRENLCSQCAMLFVFSQKGEYAFWMKDMKFDLDIIWIADGKIVRIKRNFSARALETVTPGALADSVLEVRAGLSDKYGFKEGDKVSVY